MKIFKDQFDGGRAIDVRKAAPNQYALAQHFDVSQKHKLIPYRDMVTEGSLTAYKIQSVELFTDSAGTQAYFALGNVSGQTYPQILEKTTLAGTFATSASGNGAAGTVLPTTLRGYKTKLNFLKTSGSSVIVDQYDPATDTYTSIFGTISDSAITGVYPRPMIHSLDDICYYAAGSTIAKNDNGTFTAAAVTIPAQLEVSDHDEYGPFIAMTAIPVDAGGRSKLFLWGRDTSIVEMDEAVDLGTGAAMVCANIQGRIITISSPSVSSGAAFDFNPVITFREYAGGQPNIVHELRCEDSGTVTLKNLKARRGNDVLFALSIKLENKTVNQVWRCGYNDSGAFFVTPDVLPNNDTALTGTVDGIDVIGDVTFVAYNGDGSLSRTSSSATYTATAILETEAFRSGLNETAVGASVHFEPLPSGASVKIYSRVNEVTSWGSALRTNTTQNDMRLDINSDEFTTKDGKEYHFRVESTGGAVILGLEGYTKPKSDRSYLLTLWDKIVGNTSF